MKKGLTVLIIVLSIFMLFSCSKKETAEKVYVFATDATWPPLEYIDESGNLTGFEVELVPMMAREQKLKEKLIKIEMYQ